MCIRDSEYIAKPFSPKILTARVDAIIRRAYGVDSNEIIAVSYTHLDVYKRQVLN